jgi:uncharacterized integral membrane protein
MNIFKWMCAIFLGLFVLIVVIQNYEAFSQTATFRIDLLFFRWQSPPISLYLISCITFCFGVVLTGFYSIFERFRLRREIKKLKKELSQKEKELVSLRNLPVSEEGISSKSSELSEEPISTG